MDRKKVRRVLFFQKKYLFLIYYCYFCTDIGTVYAIFEIIEE